MPYLERRVHLFGGDTMVFTVCETCGAIVTNTVAHDRHHAEYDNAVRALRNGYRQDGGGL
jgi:hypothetical protein